MGEIVGDGVGDSVGDSVGDGVGDSCRKSEKFHWHRFMSNISSFAGHPAVVAVFTS